jgi:hypothetical protein
MRRWPAWLLLCATIAACEAPSNVAVAPPQSPPQPAAAELSQEQVVSLTAKCTQASRDKFRREAANASYAHHYNARMQSCFYLVTVADSTISKKLYDIGENELYGEYLGPQNYETPSEGLPTTCRVEAMHCASEREWNVLVAQYMETD